MTSATSSFGRLLRRYRLAAGLTQEELAERAHLSARAISDLERGVKALPHHHTVELLAEALELPVEDLERAVLRRRGPRLTGELSRLPFVPTSFVGRDLEVGRLSAMLKQGTSQLVTVTGPPGIGKSRLTLATVRMIAEEFGDGAVFVPLAPLSDPALVPSALAQSLGIHPAETTPVEQQITDHLQSKHMLLVVDNFEHVLDAAPFVARILVSCPTIRLLVSSRAPLNIQGELRFDLGPLDLPPPDVIPIPDELPRWSALQLFAERAQAANSSFRVTSENLMSIVEICQRLNGLPLAIELASARLAVLSPRSLLGQFERQLNVLTGGPRDLPERHQTMRDAIAWSYELLNESERRLFRQLAYFAGGFTLEAAESIAKTHDEVHSIVLDDLTSLINNSLVRRVQSEADEPRFVMLEVMREFGLERLSECGERSTTADQHCNYVVDFVERSYLEQIGDRQSHWFRRLDQDLGNLRLAARWIVDNRDSHLAARLGLGLWRFWDRGYHQEGRRWLTAFLQLPGLSQPSPQRSRLLFASGRLAYRQADFGEAVRLLEECLSIARAETDDDFVAAALTQLGHVAYSQANLDAAERCYTESLVIRRREKDPRTIGITLHGLARVQRARGDCTRARELLTERLNYSRQVQDVVQISMATAGIGLVALIEGAYAEAESFYRESLVHALEVDDQHAAAIAMLGLGLTAIGLDEAERSVPLLQESLQIAREIDAPHLIAHCLDGFAAMLAMTGRHRQSVRLAATVEAYRERMAIPGDPAERALLASFVDHATRSLSVDERVTLEEDGRRMPLADAIASAIALPVDTSL